MATKQIATIIDEDIKDAISDKIEVYENISDL